MLSTRLQIESIQRVNDAQRHRFGGSEVLGVPQIGQELIVYAENKHWNLGTVTLVMYENSSGRNFMVRTSRFVITDNLYIKLAQGISPIMPRVI